MDKMTINKTCPNCHKPSSVEVLVSEFEAYQRGGLLHVAFASLNADEREIVKTGIHSACWDEMFSWMDYDDEE
jgi:hypothetical protein